MLTNVPARLYPTAARPPGGWPNCENLQEGPRVKDAVVTFFSPADNSNWAAARGEGAFSPGAYEAFKISRRCDFDVASPFQISARPYLFRRRFRRDFARLAAKQTKFPLSIRPRSRRGYRPAENRPKFLRDNAASTVRGLSKFFLVTLRGRRAQLVEVPTARNASALKNISDIFAAEIFISRYNGICLLHPKKDYARAALLLLEKCHIL